MVTRTQIDRISLRIEALAARANCNRGPGGTMDDPRSELMRRLQVIAERMEAATEAEGEPFPPQLSRGERDGIVRRFREFCTAGREMPVGAVVGGTQPWSPSRN